MAGYTIKGADGRDYGPVSLDTLASWIRERRLAPFTEVRVDDEPFRPASEITEIALLLQRRGRPAHPIPLPADARMHPVEAVFDAARVLRAQPIRIMGMMFVFALLFLTTALPFGLLEGVTRTLAKGPATELIAFLAEAGQSLFIGILSVGIARVFIRYADDEPASIEDAFAGFPIWPRAALAGLAVFLVRWPLFHVSTPDLTAVSTAFQAFSKTREWPPDVPWAAAAQTLAALSLALWLLGPILAFVEFLLADGAALSARRALTASVRLGFRHFVPLLAASLLGWIVAVVASFLLMSVISVAAGLLALLTVGAQGAMAAASGISTFFVAPLMMLLWGWMCALNAAVYRQVVPPGATTEPIAPPHP